jgi:ribosome-interacting GTPase 1
MPQDLILIMLDATKDDKQIEILESELHTVGIRLNSQPPDIYYKPKKARPTHSTTTIIIAIAIVAMKWPLVAASTDN